MAEVIERKEKDLISARDIIHLLVAILIAVFGWVFNNTLHDLTNTIHTLSEKVDTNTNERFNNRSDINILDNRVNRLEKDMDKLQRSK